MSAGGADAGGGSQGEKAREAASRVDDNQRVARTLARDLTNMPSVAVSASAALLDRLRRLDDQRLHSAAIEAGGLGAAAGDAASASAAG